MRATTLAAIISLAIGSRKQDDLAKLTGPNSVANPMLQAALQRKMEKAQLDAAEEAAESIISILESANSKIARHVSSIRSLRRQEKSTMKQIKELQRAIAYGNETGNWLPLSIMTGDVNEYEVREESGKKACKIPEGWTPAAPATEPVVAE